VRRSLVGDAAISGKTARLALNSDVLEEVKNSVFYD